ELDYFLSVFEQVCQTVGYAHSQGVIHRDLKPSNVMVGAFREVQVMDWGLAKVLGGDDPQPALHTENGPAPSGSTATLTAAGAVLGTLADMPPEQAQGDAARVDRRADVFALGAILCEVLTGKPPYAWAGAPILEAAKRGQVAGALATLDEC